MFFRPLSFQISCFDCFEIKHILMTYLKKNKKILKYQIHKNMKMKSTTKSLQILSHLLQIHDLLLRQKNQGLKF